MKSQETIKKEKLGKSTGQAKEFASDRLQMQ